jgi:hypothetical protein
VSDVKALLLMVVTSGFKILIIACISAVLRKEAPSTSLAAYGLIFTFLFMLNKTRSVN